MTLKKGLFIGTSVFVLLMIVYLKPFRFFDNILYDLNYRMANDNASDSVVVVGIDSKSIQKIGAMPWPRSTLASLIEKVDAVKPAAIALDFLFPRRPEQKENDSLAAVFSRVKCGLVLPFRASAISATEDNIRYSVPDGVSLSRFQMLSNSELLKNSFFYIAKEIDPSDTMFSKYATRGGFLNVSTSNTSQKLREAIQVIRAGDDYFPSFGIASAATFLHAQPNELILNDKGYVEVSDRKIPISSYAASTYINFRNENKDIRIVSASDILDGSCDPKFLNGKLVFIGVTDPMAGSDFFTTPVKSQTPGVVVWATIALDIIERAWVQHSPALLSLLNWLVVLLIFPGLALLIPPSRRILSVGSGMGILIVSIVLGMELFKNSHIIWESSSHVYSWFFSLIWLALSNANPSLAIRMPSLQLEPIDPSNSDILNPPAERDFLESIPSTDTAAFVTKTLTSIADKQADSDKEKTYSGTIVEQKLGDIKGTPRPVLKDVDVMLKFRELANGLIIRPLGSGGMADVYLVWNPRLEVYRAVKVLKPEQPTNLLKRFETEIRIFSKLDHQNIVHCHSVGDWHSLPYLEMEYINGASLEEVLTKCKVLTVEQTLIIGVLVCRALHYAHNQVITIYGNSYQGIVHRDLKPANIMLSRSGRIKLTDFGIARPGATSLHTVDTGSIVGTLPYLAPEQIDGSALTGQADIYALGVTLYELISGVRAFPHTEITPLINAKSAGIYKPLSQIAKVDKSVSDIIDMAMAVSPSKRFSTAHEFGDTMEKVLTKTITTEAYLHLNALAQRIWQ